MPYFVGEVGNDLCQIVQLGQHRGTLGLVQYCCRILLERSVQSVCILCLEENQKPRWCAGQVFLDCIVDVIPLSVAVKILDVATDVLYMTGNDHALEKADPLELAEIKRRWEPYINQLPDYAYLCKDLLNGKM